MLYKYFALGKTQASSKQQTGILPPGRKICNGHVNLIKKIHKHTHVCVHQKTNVLGKVLKYVFLIFFSKWDYY